MVIGLIAGIILLIRYLSPVLVPFCLAWLLAYLIYPIVYFIQKKLRVGNKSVSILLALLAIGALITFLIYFFAPQFAEEAVKLKNFVVEYSISNNDNGIIPHKWEIFLKEFIRNYNLAEIMDREDFLDIVKSVSPHVWSLITSSFNLTLSIFAMLITGIYLFFILRDYRKITQYFSALIPPKYRTFAQTLYRDIEEGMKQYYRGQALVAISVGILYTTGFVIIDLPMALTMGLIIGTLNMVPYLQVIGIPPCILLALVHAAETGHSPWIPLLSLLAVFVIVQIIQDGYLVPKIMGKRMGLNAAVILLSLSIFGMMFGILGLIIALPATSLMISYYKRYILSRYYSTPTNETQEFIEEENQ
ncbi:MAG: AI-2E family transporter [Paludibacteraceae bacterium]|nr:AI-2E family transporter [Paludibacteraceae bacterium]